MKIRAVIGKNFGDEGKGLAVDYFAMNAKNLNENCLVIRHNGGAQAGHTVDFPDKHFIFHQLSSGSFRNADTLWSETFLPDFYKLGSEIEDFHIISKKLPKIYADEKCRCVYIDDILINMALETSRGKNRHGSCGMGINEAVVRSLNSEFILSLGKVKGMTANELFLVMKSIRGEYVPQRLAELGLNVKNIGEYGELLTNNKVLENTAEFMSKNAEYINIFCPNILSNYPEIVFEGAQGLLLDEFYFLYEPYLTSSRTGAYNPDNFCSKYFPNEIIELVYVTRTYVTRHGNGPLPYADKFDPIVHNIIDKTNIPNDWQGTLRFAVHGGKNEFIFPIMDDVNQLHSNFSLSLMITHINETKGKLYTNKEEIPIDIIKENMKNQSIFSKLYCSNSKYSADVKCTDLC